MRAALLGLGLLVLVGCQTEVHDGTVVEIDPRDHLPDGYPPQIGVVTAEMDGTTVSWNTYDYSIGAFDASVQVLGYGDKPELRLMGETGPSSRSNRLVMKSSMRTKLQKGTLQDPLIELIAGEDMNGTRLTSAGGSRAEIVVDAITVDPEREVVGHIKGHFSANLCAAESDPQGYVVDRGACHTISGSFESDMQFSGF
jgi:hypothetical protein